MPKSPAPDLRHVALCLMLALPALAAWGQYKIVQPDGSITYTDRPPTGGDARVIPMGRDAAATSKDAATPAAVLPLELRQIVARYPVVLYTTTECPPCDAGRRLLQQRGVPYTERSVSSDEDVAALERAVGGRSLPALTIGAQQLRGLAEPDWIAYLDAAGFPRESRLPANWPAPVVSPLTARMPAPAAAPPRPAPAPRPARPAAEPAEPEAPTGLRF